MSEPASTCHDRDMPRSGLLRGACIAAALALTVVAGSAAGSPAGRTAPTHVLAKPRWQQLPGLDHGHGSGLATSGWAAGRAWFVVGSQQRLTVASARTGGGLAAQKTTEVRAPYGWDPIFLDSELLYSRAKGASGIAPLLANGGLGPAEAPSQEPMAHEVGAPVAATRTGGRIVWALAGGVAAGGGGNYKPTLWACCDATDAARDLTSLITQIVSSPPRAHALGADTQGRLWLAWIDGRPQQQELRVVQLDATTLMPRTRKALVAPVNVLGPATRTQDVALTCAASCRVVTGSFVLRPSGGMERRLVTWAPGERSATVLRLPGDESRSASPRRSVLSGREARRRLSARLVGLQAVAEGRRSRRARTQRTAGRVDRRRDDVSGPPALHLLHLHVRATGPRVRTGVLQLRAARARPRHGRAAEMSEFLDELARSLARPMPRSRAVRLLGGALVTAAVPLLRAAPGSGASTQAVPKKCADYREGPTCPKLCCRDCPPIPSGGNPGVLKWCCNKDDACDFEDPSEQYRCGRVRLQAGADVRPRHHRRAGEGAGPRQVGVRPLGGPEALQRLPRPGDAPRSGHLLGHPRARTRRPPSLHEQIRGL